MSNHPYGTSQEGTNVIHMIPRHCGEAGEAAAEEAPSEGRTEVADPGKIGPRALPGAAVRATRVAQSVHRIVVGFDGKPRVAVDTAFATIFVWEMGDKKHLV